MSLFNTKKETNKQPINEIQKAKGRRAKTAQQTIPYEEVYPNGIIKVAPGLYSKSYYLVYYIRDKVLYLLTILYQPIPVYISL